MPSLQLYDQHRLEERTKHRPGEVKVGERIRVGDYHHPNVRSVIVGVPEDIGVLANHGIGGTATAWEAFLRAFLNMQVTSAVPIQNCCMLGHLDCSDLKKLKAGDSVTELRQAVRLIDREVEQIVFDIIAAGKLPIIIGGGHNNAYPIIKGAAAAYRQNGRIDEMRINTINLDAHADFRPMEGRHSGNGFRYAFEEGFLDRYAMIGLHRDYNAQSMIDVLNANEQLQYTFWEDIFLGEQLSFAEAVDRAIAFTNGRLCGLELDLDALQDQLSSAMSPCGISAIQARQYLYRTVRKTEPAYVHICEGATTLTNGQRDHLTGKLIAYLVSDVLSMIE